MIDSKKDDKSVVKLVQALWDYEGEKIQSNLLSFKRGEVIRILKSNESNWWTGSINGKTGFLPANYTREYIEPSEIKESVTTIIKTVFKSEAIVGLNEAKERKKNEKKLNKRIRSSLPHFIKNDYIEFKKNNDSPILNGNDHKSNENNTHKNITNNNNISSNNIKTNNNTNNMNINLNNKKNVAQTLPISSKKTRTKKNSILPNKHNKFNRYFSDPCLTANDPMQVRWKKTEVEETVSVLNDIISEDGRVVFRIKQKGNQTIKTIRSGTIEGIIDYFLMFLAFDDEEHIKQEGFAEEMESIKDELKYFLCAHQRVISTSKLLGMLSKLNSEQVLPPPLPTRRESIRNYEGKYNSLKDKKQLGIFNFLSFWIQHSYYPDFVLYDGNSTPAMSKLHSFARSLSKDRKTEILQKINHQLPYIVTASQGNETKRTNSRVQFKPLPISALDIDFMELDNREIAESLTRIDADMMRKITRREFLYKDFENLKKDQPNSFYIKYAERLKKLSLWVSSQIVREVKKKKRAKVYKKLVQIAQICVELNNFSSLCAILAGIGSLAVRRLTETMKEVPTEIKESITNLESDFMGFSDSVARNSIKNCIDNKLPCIPTIDLIRTDLLRIDEGSKGDTTKGKEHIKFFKIVSFGKAIHFIEQAYSHPFEFESKKNERVPLVDEFLTLLPNTFKQKQLLMKFSFEAELPRPNEKKKCEELLKQLNGDHKKDSTSHDN